MTSIEYRNYLNTEEDNRIWDLLDSRMEEDLFERIFDEWENN